MRHYRGENKISERRPREHDSLRKVETIRVLSSENNSLLVLDNIQN